MEEDGDSKVGGGRKKEKGEGEGDEGWKYQNRKRKEEGGWMGRWKKEKIE